MEWKKNLIFQILNIQTWPKMHVSFITPDVKTTLFFFLEKQNGITYLV